MILCFKNKSLKKWRGSVGAMGIFGGGTINKRTIIILTKESDYKNVY